MNEKIIDQRRRITYIPSASDKKARTGQTEARDKVQMPVSVGRTGR